MKRVCFDVVAKYFISELNTSSPQAGLVMRLSLWCIFIRRSVALLQNGIVDSLSIATHVDFGVVQSRRVWSGVTSLYW